MIEQPDWSLAACQEHDVEVFYPESVKGKPCDWRTPKRICGGCEIRSECLEWALTTGEPYGVWGGVAERQRRKMRVARGSVQGRTFTNARAAS